MSEGRSLHFVPLALRANPISFQFLSALPWKLLDLSRIFFGWQAWGGAERIRKQAPEPYGGGACVLLLILSFCLSLFALSYRGASVLGIEDGAPVQVAVLQTMDQHLGGGNVGGHRNVVYIADAQQVHLVGFGGLGADGVAEKQ